MDKALGTPYEAFSTDRSYQLGIDHLVAFASVPAGQRVVDLGAGTGALSIAMLEHCPPAELIVVDPDEAAIATARNALGDRARYLHTTAEGLHRQLPPASVDHVLVANAIHLFDDLALATSSILTVLRPGGTFSASTAFHRDASSEEEHRLARATLFRALRELRSAPKRAANEKRMYKDREELSEDRLVDTLARTGFVDVITDSVAIPITPHFLASFLQTDIFAEAVLPDYDPEVSCPVLGRAVMEAAASDRSAGLYERKWLFVRAAKPRG
ncbi:MAG TPA: methyltransferase [Acidimicrobiales bacterium]|jgi:ubiquinone/menaquinone biosynthesis C-methylase UbiE|nr:methyltransferase [Acidimicrobiales bacterium]